LIALRDDISLPSAVVGPRDFAPLVRAVSDLVSIPFNAPINAPSLILYRRSKISRSIL
jgi:hypothetical protein